MKNTLLLIFFLSITLVSAQVKMGDASSTNPNVLDPNSILELDSDNKALVITRLTNAQMNSITPLNGALVYNTDEKCVFQYKDNNWASLCVNVSTLETTTTLSFNNADNTLRYIDEDNITTIMNLSTLVSDGSETIINDGGIVTLTGTGTAVNPYIISATEVDGSITNEIELPVGGTSGQVLSTDGSGNYTWISDNGGSDDQNITGSSFAGTTLTIGIEGGNPQDVNLSDLEESADIAANTTAINTNTTNINSNDTDIAANTTLINNHIAADADTSATNEIELPTGGTAGQVLSTDGSGNYTWTNNTGHTGTAGSIFFADTDSSPTEDNSQIFWDATNNRLGIGTNTPTHKLQVTGQVRATSFANANGTAGAPAYRFNSDGDTGMFRATTNQLDFSTDGNEAMRIDSSGNIGIGAATPTDKLDVNGNMALSGAFKDKDGDTGTSGQILSSTATGTDWINATAGSTIVSADANNILTAGADGGAYLSNSLLPTVAKTFVNVTLSANFSATGTGGASNWAKIPFNTTQFDENSDFDTTDNDVTIPATGFYQINTSYHIISSNNNQIWGIAVFVNGVNTAESTFVNDSNGDDANRQLSILLKLSLNDVVDIRYSNDDNSKNMDGNSGKTYFTIHQVK